MNNTQKAALLIAVELMLAVLIMVILSLGVLASGSGHKVVYGMVIDDAGAPVSGKQVYVYVNLTSVNRLCRTDSYSTASDGTYSIELYTLRDSNGADCRHLWQEDDAMFAVSGSSSSERSSIDCYDDPNCGGSQELPDIIYLPVPADSSAPLASDLLSGYSGHFDSDIKIISMVSNFSESAKLLSMRFLVKNRVNKAYSDLHLAVLLKDESGVSKISLSSPYFSIGQYESKEIVIDRYIPRFTPGYYYVSAELIKGSVVEDLFGDIRILLTAPQYSTPDYTALDNLNPEDYEVSEGSTGSADGISMPYEAALEEPSPVEEDENESVLALMKIVLLICFLMAIFYGVTHTIASVLKIHRK